MLPSCDRNSTPVQTLVPSGGHTSGGTVTVADCAGRSSRTPDLSLARHVRYHFTKEVLNLVGKGLYVHCLLNVTLLHLYIYIHVYVYNIMCMYMCMCVYG